jgi:uncharacterized protein (TIGR00369 family)
LTLPNEDRFAEAPISRLVGFEVAPHDADSVRDGKLPLGHAVVSLRCHPHHHNPMGRVHGGLIAALADAAMGIAFGRTLFPGEDFSTIDLKISFIRPVTTGIIRAEARVIDRGLRIGFIQCDIFGPKGKRVATASCTCSTIPGGNGDSLQTTEPTDVASVARGEENSSRSQ